MPRDRIVLMGDGANNNGRWICEAIEAAAQAKSPVSTIAFGTDSGTINIRGEHIPVPSNKAAL